MTKNHFLYIGQAAGKQDNHNIYTLYNIIGIYKLLMILTKLAELAFAPHTVLNLGVGMVHYYFSNSNFKKGNLGSVKILCSVYLIGCGAKERTS